MDEKAKRAAQREEGRRWAYELQRDAEAEGQPFAWFDALYARADGKPGHVPWEQAAPRFKLEEWLQANPGDGARAVDVGCGLGDNARRLAAAGYDVTGFDISETAASWAARRHADFSPSPHAPAGRLAFQAADLFSLPSEWVGAFDLVHETYNLQAMPPARVADAMAAVATLVAPGGRLLVMTRLHTGEAVPDGPPWPLTEAQLARFEDAAPGLVLSETEDFDDHRDPPIVHKRLVFTRAG